MRDPRRSQTAVILYTSNELTIKKESGGVFTPSSPPAGGNHREADTMLPMARRLGPPRRVAA